MGKREMSGVLWVMAGCCGDAEGFYGGRTFTENSGQCLNRCKGGEEDERFLRDVEMCALGLIRLWVDRGRRNTNLHLLP